MRTVGKLAVAFAALLGAAGLAMEPVHAQPAGIDPGKTCYSFRTCNYARGGSYRGCLSSYSCKHCRFVTANCVVDGQRKVCQRLKCGFGPVS